MRKLPSLRTLVPVVLLVAAAFCGGVAIGADADLQQYNGSPSFAADWTAQAKLLVRDGKKITADDNGAGKAPVNRGIKQLVDIIGGMHDGVFGSRVGAVRKTVKSLEADGVGGQTSSIDPAWIASTAANDRALIKPTSVQVFDRGALGGEALLTKGALAFINTVDGGGNPARTSPINNKVMPINTAKAWVNIQTQLGVVNYVDGYNITSCTVQSNTEVYCDLAITLDSTSYMPIANTALGDFVECFNTSTSRITCGFSGTQNCNGAAGCKLKLLVFGRQTT
jgi:hypothetical protein